MSQSKRRIKHPPKPSGPDFLFSADLVVAPTSISSGHPHQLRRYQRPTTFKHRHHYETEAALEILALNSTTTSNAEHHQFNRRLASNPLFSKTSTSTQPNIVKSIHTVLDALKHPWHKPLATTATPILHPQNTIGPSPAGVIAPQSNVTLCLARL